MGLDCVLTRKNMEKGKYLKDGDGKPWPSHVREN